MGLVWPLGSITTCKVNLNLLPRYMTSTFSPALCHNLHNFLIQPAGCAVHTLKRLDPIENEVSSTINQLVISLHMRYQIQPLAYRVASSRSWRDVMCTGVMVLMWWVKTKRKIIVDNDNSFQDLKRTQKQFFSFIILNDVQNIYLLCFIRKNNMQVFY